MRSHRAAMAIVAAAAMAALWSVAGRSLAHCDSMDGPIIPLAQRALDSGDVVPLLKWVREEDEAAIRDAFVQARGVRDRGEDIREVADRLFLETLIRIHRAGEGEPFTGLQPAGSSPPIFGAADAALDAGSVDALADELAEAVRRQVHERFDAAVQRRPHMDDSVEAGREYVAAYVGYMHFVEGVHAFLQHGAASGHGELDSPARNAHWKGGDDRDH